MKCAECNCDGNAENCTWFGRGAAVRDYGCHVHGMTEAYYLNGRFPTCRACLEAHHGVKLSGGKHEFDMEDDAI